MPENLLKSKRFLPLLLTQFFGALNDNLFKNALLMLVTLRMADKADKCPNRVMHGPFCTLKECPGETPMIGHNGRCLSCQINMF